MRLLLLCTLLPCLCAAAENTYGTRLAVPAEPLNKYCAAPTWPASAQESNASGSVIVDVQIAPDGHVEQTRILKSSGQRDLDKAVMVAATRCKYAPQTVNNQPVRAWLKLEHQWEAK
jgi:periplasmic protein TonB